MIGDILVERIRAHGPANALEQELVLAELLQRFVLASLARGRFFQGAGFQGGTFLRIVHCLERFSEDLDFLLRDPDPTFSWASSLERILDDGRAQGMVFEAQDKSDAPSAVKKALLKAVPLGGVRATRLPFPRHPQQKLRIKLEVDTNPPAGARFETHYLDFPRLSALTTQTLPSSFAGKAHALLCREFVKGRDWFDFLWYVSRKVVPDLPFLESAVDQQGPWAGRRVRVSKRWFLEAMRERVESIDWAVARQDVERFVPAKEAEGLELWDQGLFLYHLDRLAALL